MAPEDFNQPDEWRAPLRTAPVLSWTDSARNRTPTTLSRGVNARLQCDTGTFEAVAQYAFATAADEGFVLLARPKALEVPRAIHDQASLPGNSDMRNASTRVPYSFFLFLIRLKFWLINRARQSRSTVESRTHIVPGLDSVIPVIAVLKGQGGENRAGYRTVSPLCVYQTSATATGTNA